MGDIINIIQHIKKTYLYFMRGIDEAFNEFYTYYASTLERQEKYVLKPATLSMAMALLGIRATRRKVNKKIITWYTIEYEKLNEIIENLAKTSSQE